MRRGLVLADRYELDQPLRRGGTGEVWRAYDRLLDRRLAVRFILVDEAGSELISRFRQEARSAAWLEHPGVPTVHDLGEHHDEVRGPSLYLVTQYIDGLTLDHLIDAHGTLPVSWAAFITAQVCGVLSVAHQRPLMHRDLKPGNLMLCGDGSVKVLDFGITAGLAPGDVRRTATGQDAPLTPGYTAPEQLYGTPCPQSDLYSLGCVTYELLSGQEVFPAATPYEMMRRHEDEVPMSLRELLPDIPAALDALVLQMLAKRPADRPADADEVCERVLRFVTDLEPLPGSVDIVPPPARSARLYAGVLARIPATGNTSISPEVPSLPATLEEVKLPSQEEVAQGRAEAADLASSGRFTQAAELLSDMAEPALLSLGDDDLEVLGLRLDLASVLHQSGEHRRAIPAYRVAAVGLAERHGPDDDRVLHCREQTAVCLAQVGHAHEAIRLLEKLLTDVSGREPYDDLILRVRGHIGRLWLTAGRPAEGRQELSDLLADIRSVHGDDHAQVPGLVQLLDDPHL
ncbi:serine/threonine protein kinase PkaE [Actinomadura viridis]|uniref:non-specific serine/threonine protein kinase n=1 Tax=Actinomadura viridis TaxID=58110 RepID=A0A931DLA5_9ACTN|nr:serine/threonine-protein kinase [Actinomadura viridis]MBG6090774.1 serine/threonine protein kinase [Actinomadura viridis]